MILSLLNLVLQFEHGYLKSLLLNLCEPYVYRGELFLIFGLFNQAEVALEVALVLLLFTQGLVPGDQQVVKHKVGDDLEYSLNGELYAYLVFGDA